MIGDLYGDWREEIVTSLPGEIRIYSTNIPAKDRRTCLMQDPIYRSYICQRSMGYPQAPVPSYYLGEQYDIILLKEQFYSWMTSTRKQKKALKN